MGLKDDISKDVDSILMQPWDVRSGTVVPTTDSVKLAGGAVKLDAVMLYADLADSTELVLSQDRRIVAKIYKAFLAAAARLIKANKGAIRSFDGDRIMGVFLGELKRNNAVTCALQLSWAFQHIVKPKILAKYNVETTTFKLEFSTGIDLSDILVVLGGVFADNDLLWVGRSANIAAKLSAIREPPYRLFITQIVYDGLNDSQKTSTDAQGKKVNIWTYLDLPISKHIGKILKTNYYRPVD